MPIPGVYSMDSSVLTWRAQFRDEDLEAAFQESQRAELFQLFSYALTILLIIGIANLTIDLYYQRGGAESSVLLFVRVFAVLLSGAVLAALVLTPASRWVRLLLEVYVVIFVGLTALMILRHESYGFIGPITQVGTIFAIYLLLPFPWYRLLTYALLFSLAGLIGWGYKLGVQADLFHIGLWIFFANSLGAFISRRRNLFERRLFAAHLTQDRQLETERLLRRRNTTLVDLITHELRNPMAAIHVQADLIQRLTAEPRVGSAASKIIHECARSEDLIAEWMQGDRVTYCDIPSEPPLPVEDVVFQILADIAKRHPELPVRLLAKSLPPVCIDPRVLALALTNVIENAVKYASSEHGITLQYRIWERRVGVRIRDFGPGIHPNEQERIFQKYARVKQTRQVVGTGIGLYLVRDLLERCGGGIRLQSLPGLGSAFIIEIPRA